MFTVLGKTLCEACCRRPVKDARGQKQHLCAEGQLPQNHLSPPSADKQCRQFPPETQTSVYTWKYQLVRLLSLYGNLPPKWLSSENSLLISRGVLKREKKVFLNGSFAERPRVAHMFNHGRWQLAVGGGWWW